MKIVGIIILILIILIGGYFLFIGTGTQEPSAQQMQEAAQERQAAEEAAQELGESAYVIDEGSSVSYTVQKEFFSQPTEAVTGTTADVSGVVVLDEETHELTVTARANPQTLLSGSQPRDNYVHEQFSSDITIVVENVVLARSMGEVSETIPLQLTMNGITQTVDFAVTANVSDEEGITASGTGTIDMTDFAITPATLAGVYEVAPVATLSFSISARSRS